MPLSAKALLTAAFVLAILLSVVTGSPFIQLAAADSAQSQLIIAMPQEYVNYTVSMINGSLWATVDGTFPMHLPPEWVSQEIPMLYPTPKGTATDISISLDAQQVSWTNYTQANPNALHYTYLGEWPMILCVIQPTSQDFQMKIHYQHPISNANGSYAFLYDLNISPYLSPSSSNSIAYFNVRMETNYTDVQVYTVPGDSSTQRDNTRTPMNFTITKTNSTENIAFNITSDYAKPVPGDELVTFQDSDVQVGNPPSTPSPMPLTSAQPTNAAEPTNSVNGLNQLSNAYPATAVAAIIAVITTAAVIQTRRSSTRKKRAQARSN
jgi:hypothetical protein